MRSVLGDPGPCPVDDAPHTTCTAPTDDTVVVVQLPARDGVPVAPLLAQQIQATLPPGQVTTGTYRGSSPRKKRD